MGTIGATLPVPPNMVQQIVNEIYERILRLYLEGTLIEKIDRIPFEMRPREFGHPSRCCVYRDRAMIRYRILAILGLRIEEEGDEARPLSYFAELALRRTPDQITRPVLTVISEACNKCTRQQYLVTDACQNCVAKPCAQSCPKGAIDTSRGRSRIDIEKCIKCGKCQSVCPYHAIIDIPIPCVKACPVGAITGLPDGTKQFDWNKCISCGNCQRSCPFGAVMPRSQLLDVVKEIQKPDSKVVALMAPAISGHFGAMSLQAVSATIKKLGFFDVIEVALGADITAIEEAHEFVERMEHYKEKKPGALPFMTTSCCPAYTNCIKKHIPDLEDAVSKTPTPMYFTSELAKKRHPGCMTVFIGPCDAKLDEAIGCKYTDFAVTFNEIQSFIKAKGIKADDVKAAEASAVCDGNSEARGFPVIGGVAAAVAAFLAKKPEAGITLQPVVIDGLNPASVKRLRGFAKKPPPGNIVEIMACEGGCIAGPGTVVPGSIATARVKMVTLKTQSHPDAIRTPIHPTIIRGDTTITPDDK